MDSGTTESFDAAATGVRPQFHGTAGAMFPIVFKGLLLTVVTLGVYRFWYMTNVRRFLWNNSEVDGDFLEYTGRGVELFIGFLIALAVLIPLYGVIFLAATQMGPIGGQILQSVFTFLIIVLAQYALYRARRYRLTRTVWRGIRFQQSGSGWTYAWRSLAWSFLVGLTLGLALPWMRASLERYKVRNTWYGDQKGEFGATGWQLFKRGVLLWIIGIVLLVGPVTLLGFAEAQGTISASSPAHFTLVLSVVTLLVIGPLYFAIEYKWWVNGCSVGPATARCDMGLFAFLKIYAGYIGVVILFGIVIGLLGGGVFYAIQQSGVLESPDLGPAQIAVIVLGVAAYFVIALVFSALWQLFGIRPMWRKSLETVAIVGLPALMAAQSQEPEANAFGEGVADAIDFGGF